MPDEVIAAIRRRERNGAIDLPKKRGLKTGDRVRIVPACSRVAPVRSFERPLFSASDFTAPPSLPV
jgi:hypothetical protein